MSYECTNMNKAYKTEILKSAELRLRSFSTIFAQSYSEAHREMICIESQYFSLNRTLLIAVGLWPYKQSKFVRLQFIFFLSTLTSAILFQFTALLTVNHTSDYVVKILSTAFFFTLFVIKYISFAVNIENVKYLLTQLQHIYNNIKDEYEYVIIEKYSYN
ncbi:PREDICTED: uncharacterized protein LOC105460278, partial [Wasmannia auropunctata]|uniref:uncharacterized protein LOC105460278 n=1 Tax=Wasmannia auropunctata TaxID=64793 RepID=UPI0005F009E3